MEGTDQATECFLQTPCDQKENEEAEDGCREKKNGIGPNDVENVAMGFL